MDFFSLLFGWLLVNNNNSDELKIEYIDQNCSSIVTVATVDTGVDLNNSVLVKKIKRDNNGNLRGASFGSMETVQDFHGHGTHIFDLISRYDECIRIIPFSYNVDLGFQKFFNTKDSFISALEAAVQSEAQIINISGGGSGYFERELELIKKAEESGKIIVAAVGNEGKNVDKDENKFYPGSYKTKNMITVGAIDSSGNYYTKSNYGESVDIAALGKDVSAMWLNNQIASISGTSQATAIVSGAIAKAMLLNENLTPGELKLLLFSSAVKTKKNKKYFSGGRVLNPTKLFTMVKKQKVDSSIVLKQPLKNSTNKIDYNVSGS